jgi:hypothetical protein
MSSFPPPWRAIRGEEVMNDGAWKIAAFRDPEGSILMGWEELWH